MGLEDILAEGATLFRLGRFSESIDKVNTGISILMGSGHPNARTLLSNAYGTRANAHLKLGKYQEALGDYNNAIEYGDKHPSYYHGLGRAYEELGLYKQAITEYTNAINKPQQPITKARTYYSRGFAKRLSGDLQGASEDFQAAIDINSNDHGAYHLLGITYQENNQLDDAIKNLKTAIQKMPKQEGTYYYNLGFAQHKKVLTQDQNNTELLREAFANYNQAIQLDKNLAYAYSRRSAIKYRFGDLQGAYNDCKQALALDPNIAEAKTNLVTLKEKLMPQQQQQTSKLDSEAKVHELERDLRIAASKNEDKTLQKILDEHGDDINIDAQDENPVKRKTALHWAVISGSTACVRLLLNAGARTDIKDATGHDAEYYAQRSDNPSIKRLINDTKTSAANLPSNVNNNNAEDDDLDFKFKKMMFN